MASIDVSADMAVDFTRRKRGRAFPPTSSASCPLPVMLTARRYVGVESICCQARLPGGKCLPYVGLVELYPTFGGFEPLPAGVPWRRTGRGVSSIEPGAPHRPLLEKALALFRDLGAVDEPPRVERPLGADRS